MPTNKFTDEFKRDAVAQVVDRCSIPDDHIDPRRSALFMARSVLGDIRENAQC